MKEWFSWESTYWSGTRSKRGEVKGRWKKGRVINTVGIISSE